MNVGQSVATALALAQGVLASLIKNDAAAEAIADAAAAVEALLKVQGSAVTYGQLEAMRNDDLPPFVGAV